MSTNRNYWLMKSEPDAFSIDDLAAVKNEPWDGIRNYQARNFMREMKVGDGILFYHSSCKIPGVVGTAEVTKEIYPDHTAWDPSSKYFDSKSTPDKPRWEMVDVALVEKWPNPVTLKQLKAEPALGDFMLLRKGMRLSIMPVTQPQWECINKMR